MKESESLTNNLLMEVDVLSNRLRNIKHSFKTTNNKGLQDRLFSENKSIFKRVDEIHKIAELLNKKNNDQNSEKCRKMQLYFFWTREKSCHLKKKIGHKT